MPRSVYVIPSRVVVRVGRFAPGSLLKAYPLALMSPPPAMETLMPARVSELGRPTPLNVFHVTLALLAVYTTLKQTRLDLNGCWTLSCKH